MAKYCKYCGDPARSPRASYCDACFNGYRRAWRKANPAQGDARQRELSRQRARNAKAAGVLNPQPCQICGEPAQMHHPDYGKPLAVEWMCRPCHVAHHQEEIRRGFEAFRALVQRYTHV